MLLRLPSPGSLEPDVHETGAVLEAARDTFDRIVAHFEAIDPYPDLPYPQRCTTYSKPLLIRNMYKYARSEESQNVFLRAFFGWMELPMDSNADLDFQELAPRFSEVARYLIVKLFTPCKPPFYMIPPLPPPWQSSVYFHDIMAFSTYTT